MNVQDSSLPNYFCYTFLLLCLCGGHALQWAADVHIFPDSCSVTSCWERETSHGGNIHIRDTRKHQQPAPFSPNSWESQCLNVDQKPPDYAVHPFFPGSHPSHDLNYSYKSELRAAGRRDADELPRS